MTEQIRRVAVWSGWLRVSHAALALSTLVLLATGWLLASSPTLAGAATDIHYLAASILIAALVLRLVIGFLEKARNVSSTCSPGGRNLRPCVPACCSS